MRRLRGRADRADWAGQAGKADRVNKVDRVTRYNIRNFFQSIHHYNNASIQNNFVSLNSAK